MTARDPERLDSWPQCA